MAMKTKIRLYLLGMRVKTPRGTVNELVCYALKVIRPEQLKKFYPETKLVDLKSPDNIDLLI